MILKVNSAQLAISVICASVPETVSLHQDCCRGYAANDSVIRCQIFRDIITACKAKRARRSQLFGSSFSELCAAHRVLFPRFGAHLLYDLALALHRHHSCLHLFERAHCKSHSKSENKISFSVVGAEWLRVYIAGRSFGRVRIRTFLSRRPEFKYRGTRVHSVFDLGLLFEQLQLCVSSHFWKETIFSCVQSLFKTTEDVVIHTIPQPSCTSSTETCDKYTKSPSVLYFSVRFDPLPDFPAAPQQGYKIFISILIVFFHSPSLEVNAVMSDCSENRANPLLLLSEVTSMLARLCLEAYRAHSELLTLFMSLSTLHNLPLTNP